MKQPLNTRRKIGKEELSALLHATEFQTVSTILALPMEVPLITLSGHEYRERVRIQQLLFELVQEGLAEQSFAQLDPEVAGYAETGVKRKVQEPMYRQAQVCWLSDQPTMFLANFFRWARS
jgi:hypothetical protein